jgi:uroporphyrinogen-III synthase
MTILFTRPHALSILSQQKLLKLDMESVVIPLINIKNLNVAIADDHYDIVIFTSQHAVHVVLQNLWIKAKKIFTVGDKTKEMLLHNECQNVVSSNGDVFDLESMITKSIATSSKLLYLSGDHISHDLDESLKIKGYDITKKIVYEAQGLDSLTNAQIKQINSSISTILFYSPRTAEIFAKLALKYELNLNDKTAICISKNCSASISKISWREIKNASHPTEKEMFKLL